MGVSMCSQTSNSGRRNIHKLQFQHPENFQQSSEEWEDTDDDSDYFNLRVRANSMVIQKTPDLRKDVRHKRAKSVHVVRSREEKTKDRRRSSVVNREAELQAKRWSEMVMDDTLKNLSQTIRSASSAVEIGEAINNELARQDRVLSNAETDISKAEYETDQVTQTLKGMKSLRGKLNNVIWKKKPKLRRIEFDCKTSNFSNVNLDLLEDDVGLCAFSKIGCKSSDLFNETSEDAQQIQFKAGMGELHRALDIMTAQQTEAAWALESNEQRLSMFENQLTTTSDKIKCQSQMIKRIME